MNVLIAEDDPPCQRLFRDLLSDRPEITLTFSNNGAEAWWHLTDAEAQFQLVITDVAMPGVNGMQLLKRIRETPRLQQMPVIVCSGLKDRQIVQEAVTLNATHYMLKPFLPGPMRTKIETILTEAAKK